jgi:hypothetical protein
VAYVFLRRWKKSFYFLAMWYKHLAYMRFFIPFRGLFSGFIDCTYTLMYYLVSFVLCIVCL